MYELSNHLGNVISTISDRKLAYGSSTVDYFNADVLSYSDYYPFGMTMPGRQYNGGDYRYGFQSQETDPEMLGGAVAFKYRVHDVRIGRFLSVDPLSKNYAWNSPYAFAENNVIAYVDLEGLEKIYAADGRFIGQYGKSTEIKIVYHENVAQVQSLYKAYVQARLNHDDQQIEYTAKALKSLITNTEVMRDPIYSKDGIAEDWGRRYNYQSIKNGLEYGGYIFKIEIEGQTSYSYITPTEGSKDGFHLDPKKIPKPEEGNEIVAMIHSHGNAKGGGTMNNTFSPDDYGIVGTKDTQTGEEPYFYDQYLVTPKGQLLYFARDYNDIQSVVPVLKEGTLDYDAVYEYIIGKERGIKSDKPYKVDSNEESDESINQ